EAGNTVVGTDAKGIANVLEANVAKEHGIGVIITDHRETQARLTDTYAIMHPKSSESYQFKDVAAAAVAVPFEHYLLEYFPTELLDFVATGTVAHLVPLRGENRILTYFGMDALTNTLNIGLEALKASAGITENVTEQDIGFKLGPRINA